MSYTDFQTDLARGKTVEYMIDEYYADKFDSIEEVTVAEEIAKGHDRIYKHGERTFTVEYKHDEKSALTGNIYVELTVDSPTNSSLGWAKKSNADIFMIYAGSGTQKGLYIIKNQDLKMALPLWQSDFRTRKSIVSRDGDREWWATGVCVPITEFARYCFKFVPETDLKGL